MPTAAKLCAALAFAVVAFFSAEIVKPHMPDGINFGYFSPVCAAIGAFCGWFIMGRMTGQGYLRSMTFGLQTMIAVVFWCLMAFSVREMILRSTNLRYDGPMEALLGALQLFLEYGQMMLQADVILTVLLGGILAGMFTEWGGRNWR